MDSREPIEVVELSSTQIKQNARPEVSRNQDSAINKDTVKDGKSLAKSNKVKEVKVKSDDLASEYKKPKDKSTKKSALEHKKLSISTYQEENQEKWK